MKNYFPILLVLLFGYSCSKSPLKIREIHIHSDARPQQRLKTPSQFISIAWSDLTGSNIDPQLRDNLQATWESFGDEHMAAELIIRNLVSRPEVQIPEDSSMRKDPGGFIRDACLRFYNRKPDPWEAWEMERNIHNDSSGKLNPSLIWIGIMTSEEYRFQ